MASDAGILHSASANSREEIMEAMSAGLVVGGTIVVPHLRRAVEFLDDLEELEGDDPRLDGQRRQG